MRLEDIKDKKVLILGFGKEGRDTLQFLRRLFPNKVIGIADASKAFLAKNQKSKIKNQKSIREDRYIKWHLGKDYLKAIKDYDIIIKSPGIPIHLPAAEAAFEQGKVSSATEIFFNNCPGIIIGITGTKGKGTTAALIYKFLKDAGKKVHLVGNIGRPGLRLLLRSRNRKENIFVFELSSHQLYRLKKSPHIAVFLNLYPDHLDYYKDFEEYKAAKENIVHWQTRDDFLLFNGDDKLVKAIAKKAKAKKIPFSLRRLNRTLAGKKNESVNLLSLSAAVAVARLFKISVQEIKKSLSSFKPLPHRLEFVGQFQGIKFYDDSAATIPPATVAAIEALKQDLQTIILGGSDKGSDYKELAKKILQSRIQNIILFPTTGQKIWQEISSLCSRPVLGYLRHFFVKSMKEAVELAFKHTEKRKVCLLSPASASFTLFRDYRQRGVLFRRYVTKAKGVKLKAKNCSGKLKATTG